MYKYNKFISKFDNYKRWLFSQIQNKTLSVNEYQSIVGTIVESSQEISSNREKMIKTYDVTDEKLNKIINKYNLPNDVRIWK